MHHLARQQALDIINNNEDSWLIFPNANYNNLEKIIEKEFIEIEKNNMLLYR